MNRFLKLTCVLLALVLILSIPAKAVENGNPRASYFFIKSCVTLCEISGSYFEAWFDVTGTGIMDEIGVSFIKIQRSSDCTNWTTVCTYTKESYPSLITRNTANHTAGLSYVGTEGYYYRAHIQLYAKNSNGMGTMNEYTAPIYIPRT